MLLSLSCEQDCTGVQVPALLAASIQFGLKCRQEKSDIPLVLTRIYSAPHGGNACHHNMKWYLFLALLAFFQALSQVNVVICPFAEFLKSV